MLRISLPYLIDAVSSLAKADLLAVDQPVVASLFHLFELQRVLDNLHSQSLYAGVLVSSYGPSTMLRGAINTFTTGDFNRVMTQYDVYNLQRLRDEYRIALTAELNILATYFVSVKGGFDTQALLGAPARLFPRELMLKAPETNADVSEVGKTLAFDLPTACGFHTFRVVEAVVRRYWDHLADGIPHPMPMSLGRYAAELETKQIGEPRIHEAMKQMAKLHRNPLAHPEVILTLDEAIGAIGMANSLLTQLLAALPILPPDPSVPLTNPELA